MEEQNVFARRLSTQLKISTIRVFTLIELLVVISIISILAGLLLPSLIAARARGKGISCTSNVKQLSTANVSYSTDSGYFAPYQNGDTGMAGLGKMWNGNRYEDGDKYVDLTAGGFLSPYISDSADVLICPDWKLVTDKTRVVGGAGYGYNVYGVGSHAYLTGSAYYSGAGMKAVLFAEPSKTIAFADSCNGRTTATELEGYSSVYPYYRVSGTGDELKSVTFSSINSRGDNIHFRHTGVGNIGWLDGHVSSEKPLRVKASDLARTELIGNIGPEDNSLFDPWNL